MKSYADWRRQESMIEYTFHTKQLKRMILSMFEWTGFPHGISTRFLEKELYEKGLCVLHVNKYTGGLQLSSATPIGLNIYDEPMGYRVFDKLGYSEHVKATDCVAIWNDDFAEPNIHNVNYFAKRISNIEKTIDINLEQLKRPTIIACPESQLKSIQLFMEKVSNGEPYIPVDNDFMNMNTFQVLDMKAQNHVKELYESKNDYRNESMTFFGIDNVNITKRERLITNETTQNDEQITLNRNAMMNARKRACEEINRMFGLNVQVRYGAEMEVEENVEVHDNSPRTDSE